MLPSNSLEDKIKHLMEKAILYDWLNIIQSVEKPASVAQLSWAQRVQDEEQGAGMSQ